MARVWWHFWDGRGDLATWVTTAAVVFAGWELRAGARRRVREQASQVEVWATENRPLGRMSVNGVHLDFPTHEVHLRNGSMQPVYFPHLVLAKPTRIQWPWLRHRKIGRGALVPYDHRDGVVDPGQEADNLCDIRDDSCYVVFRDSNGRDWCRDVVNQSLRRVHPWSGVVRFDKRLMPAQTFIDPLEVENHWRAKHNPS